MNILNLVKQANSLSPNMQAFLKQTSKTQNPRDNSNHFSKEDLRGRLTDLEYNVTQEKHTERPFSGKYVHENRSGTYRCLVCGSRLFDSQSKFYSSSGWPSFSDVLDRKSLLSVPDTSSGQFRIEVKCSRCNSHLGHVFDDGPKPTGLRFCINSCALVFDSSMKT